MALNAATLLSQVVSHMMTLGLFERVNKHEPKNAPGNGLNAAVWVQTIKPVLTSGLGATSAQVVFTARIYKNMLAEPQDDIDPNLIRAVDVVMNSYSGDFDLGGNVREVDLLGEHGESLSAQAGYLDQSGKLFRIMDITIPLIINDVWTQVA